MRWKFFVIGGLLGSLVFQTLPTSAAQRNALPVPYLNQFDGSAYAASDCGPASVAMVINYATGEHVTPLQARKAIINLPGAGYAANPESGTAIQDLARVARAHGVEVFLGDGAGSTGWGPERIRKHLASGHPVIVLTRLAYMPGYSPTTQIDHYIVLTGATPAGYVYNDPALGNGAGRTIGERQLQLAQRASSVPTQGAAFGGRPEPTRPTVEAAQVPDGPTFQITVASGDTLSEIAEHYHIELQQIVALNRPSLWNINHIEVGQVLTLPAPAPEPEPVAAPAPEKTAPAKAAEPVRQVLKRN